MPFQCYAFVYSHLVYHRNKYSDGVCLYLLVSMLNFNQCLVQLLCFTFSQTILLGLESMEWVLFALVLVIQIIALNRMFPFQKYSILAIFTILYIYKHSNCSLIIYKTMLNIDILHYGFIVADNYESHHNFYQLLS